MTTALVVAGAQQALSTVATVAGTTVLKVGAAKAGKDFKDGIDRQALLHEYWRIRHNYIAYVRRQKAKNPRITYQPIPVPYDLKNRSRTRIMGSIRRLKAEYERFKRRIENGEWDEKRDEDEELLEKLEELINIAMFNPIQGAIDHDWTNGAGEVYDSAVRLIRSHGKHANRGMIDHGSKTILGRRIMMSNLKRGFDQIYEDMELYIYGYESMKLGELGDYDLLMVVLAALSRVDAVELTESDKKGIDDFLTSLDIVGDEYYG